MVILEDSTKSQIYTTYGSDESINTYEDILAIEPTLHEGMQSVIPESLSSAGDYFRVFTDLIVEASHREILKMNEINAVLDADSASSDALEFLSIKYGIEFPSNYSSNAQRFLLKYYPNFIKKKGTDTAVNILHLIGRSESEFYTAEDLGEFDLVMVSEGYLKIIPNSVNLQRIQDNLSFAQKIINKVTPSGMYLQISV